MKLKAVQAGSMMALLLVLGGSALLLSVPLTMSVDQMKYKAALALDTSASVSSTQAEVLSFIHATHLATNIEYQTCSSGNGSSYLAMGVRAKALLSPPIYLECYFRRGRLTAYSVLDCPASALPSSGPTMVSCAPSG